MKRGDVMWADLPAPIGRRPVLLLSRDRAYAVRTAITVAFITTTIRNIPAEVKLSIRWDATRLRREPRFDQHDSQGGPFKTHLHSVKDEAGRSI